MKIILNKDLSTLGEEGDVRDVARGYARNYLFPRGIALPYTPATVKLFESRKAIIEDKKTKKRLDASGLKEKLESLDISITMPAGANGKLYGSVTSQNLSDELSKHGYQIERKRIELPLSTIKNAGKYKAIVKLYENSSAEIQVSVIAQVAKTEAPASQSRTGRRRREETVQANTASVQAIEETEAEINTAE
jgi:large subunit ribosomal protein L9